MSRTECKVILLQGSASNFRRSSRRRSAVEGLLTAAFAAGAETQLKPRKAAHHFSPVITHADGWRTYDSWQVTVRPDDLSELNHNLVEILARRHVACDRG